MTGQGAMAPIAGHTGTGHQAQRTAVDILDVDGADVVTDFHPDSETSKTLLYGSNFVEIQPSTTGANPGSSQTFTFSNDVDAIGDMYVRVQCQVLATNAATGISELPQLALARLIDRAEIMVGNSTWQTMENADIIAMASTTLSNGAYDILDAQARGKQTADQFLEDRGTTNPFGTNPKTLVCWFPLSSFTSGGPARAHLVAGAPHQSVRVKFTYASDTSLGANLAVSNLAVQLWNRQHIMTNAERDQIRNNTIAKTLRLTQHAEHTGPTGVDKHMQVELDSFSLLASHLIIIAESTSDRPSDTTNPAFLKSAELLLNTSSHSGSLPGSFMQGMAAASMGLQVNLVDSLESDNTIISNDNQSGVRRDFYVFPIASTPYGADGCPFNRFDTIRLKLDWGYFPGQVSVTCVGTTTAVYKNQAASVLYFS
jgi:hypothetical protein